MEVGSNRKNMKRFINIIVGMVVLATLSTSCQKEEQIQTIDQALVGEWHLTEIKAEGIIINEGLDCYLLIASDCTFELYQQSGTQSVRFEKYTGTCSYVDGLLTGVYNNGKPWGGKYIVDAQGNTLTLSSYNLLEVQTYERKDIPEDVRKNAHEIYTKSGDHFGTPIL